MHVRRRCFESMRQFANIPTQEREISGSTTVALPTWTKNYMQAQIMIESENTEVPNLGFELSAFRVLALLQHTAIDEISFQRKVFIQHFPSNFNTPLLD